MKQRAFHASAAFAAPLLFLGPPAAAAVPVEASFAAAGSTVLEGPHRLDWSALAATLVGQDGVLDVELEVENGTLTVVNNPRVVVVRNDLPEGRRAYAVEQEEEVVHRTAVEGRVLLRAHPVGMPLLRLLPREPGEAFLLQSEAATASVDPLSIAAGDPVRGLLYTALLRRGAATQDELLAVLASSGRALSRSTCSYHLGLMVRGGLLRTEWCDGRKQFRVAVDARDARVEQYRRYLHNVGALPLIKAIDRDGPVDATGAARWLGRTPQQRPGPLLTRLCRLGILDERHHQYHLGAAVSSIASRLGDAP